MGGTKKLSAPRLALQTSNEVTKKESMLRAHSGTFNDGGVMRRTTDADDRVNGSARQW